MRRCSDSEGLCVIELWFVVLHLRPANLLHFNGSSVYNKAIMFVHRFKRMIPPLHDMAVMFAPGRRGLEPLHCGSNDTNRFNSSQKQQHGGANDFQIAKHNANLIHARSTITYRRCFSSSSVAPRNSHPTNITERDARNKGIFSKIWDRYSFQGQQKRILLGERLFRSAQHRANDP